MRWILAAALLTVGCSETPKSETFTLYRNSPIDRSLRIHVATFDAVDHEGYNLAVCGSVSDYYNEAPPMDARYWCESGRFQE